MPHVHITMIPGRDQAAKKEIAQRVQQFLAKELNISDKFVSVSIEDIPKEQWSAHMDGLGDKEMFVEPGV